MLRRNNTLATPGSKLAIDELVIDTQKLYLEAARRYVDGLRGSAPAWAAPLLEDWEWMLDAMNRLDRDWLARRLDAFAKYEFYSAVLQQNGHSWSSLPRSQFDLRPLGERWPSGSSDNQQYPTRSGSDALRARHQDTRSGQSIVHPGALAGRPNLYGLVVGSPW